MLPRDAVNLDFFYRTDTANSGQIRPRLVAGTEYTDDLRILFGQGAVSDAGCSSYADSREAKVMNECQWFAGFQGKKQNETPTPLHGRREIHPSGSCNDLLLNDARIVP